MKKRIVASLFAAALATTAGIALCACGDTEDGKSGGEQPAPVTYTVSYNGAGGANASQAKTVNENTEITVADGITKTGYAFSGWTYSGNTYNAGDKYKVTSDTTFVAAWTPYTYTVKFDGNGGNGEMSDIACTYDESKALPDNEYMLGAAEFKGWSMTKDGQVAYADGVTVKNLTAENNGEVTLYAVWDMPAPIGFSQAEYFYDKAGGEDMELPVNLRGATVTRIEVDGASVDGALWRFDSEKNTIVIAEEYLVLLALGDHELKLITDSLSDVVPTCKLTAENSIKSGFVTSDRVIKYDAMLGLDYAVTGDVTVKSLKCGDIIVPADMYSFAGGVLTIDGEWISKFINKAEFTLCLSNNDVYMFDVYNNTVFCTDYDITTVHDETVSDIGLNPLYQYSENASIVDAPAGSGMTGRALKITPNTVDVTYDCNGYITLAADNFDSTWRKGGFKSGKYYAVSFDYYTVGTSVGEFEYKSQNNNYSEPLLLGAENDNKLHHFSDAISYDDIDGTGLMLWAKFVGGGGEVYVDNFRIVELDSAATVTSGDYLYGSGNNYELTVEHAGAAFELYLGDEKLDCEKDVDGAVTLSAETMSKFELGNNIVRLVTMLYETTFNVRVADTRKAELIETTAHFGYYDTGNIRLKGNFEDVSIVSLKQKAKSDNGGYQEWEFWHSDTDTDYKSYATIVPGLNGIGYLEINREFLKKFYGTTKFDVEFSNGGVQEITINSDVAFASNYDESNIVGYLNGGLNTGYVDNSGLHGAATEIKDKTAGDKAFYITDTSGSEEPNVFTVKFHEHVWTWLRVAVDEQKYIRITFDYQISDVTGVYFLIMKETAEEYESNFFGDGIVTSVGSWQEVRYDLACDGQVHTFDSGWFTYNSALRMTRIFATVFSAAEGRFIMLDNYTVTQTDKLDPVQYLKGQSKQCEVDVKGKTITEISYNNVNYAVVMDDKVTLDKEKLEALAYGTYCFTVRSNTGNIPLAVTVKGAGTTNITETAYSYVYGSGDLQVQGTVDGVIVITASKKGSLKVRGRITDSTDNMRELDISPTQLDPADFVVSGGKLTIKQALLDTFYLTTEVTIVFSNGESASLSITSNVRFFNDVDGTEIEMAIHNSDGSGINGYMSQDTSQMTVVDDGTGNHMIRYCTFEATLGHAKNDVHNMVFDIATGWGSEGTYAKYLLDGSPILAADKDYVISFDYKIVNADGQDIKYAFRRFGKGDEAITGIEGTFTTKLIGGDEGVTTVGICCINVGGAEGCFMLIDNYRILEVDKE